MQMGITVIRFGIDKYKVNHEEENITIYAH